MRLGNSTVWLTLLFGLIMIGSECNVAVAQEQGTSPPAIEIAAEGSGVGFSQHHAKEEAIKNANTAFDQMYVELLLQGYTILYFHREPARITSLTPLVQREVSYGTWSMTVTDVWKAEAVVVGTLVVELPE